MKELKSTKEAQEILEILRDTYPEPQTVLNYNNPFELLIAVILSAQTTDKQVNKVTKDLFKKFKSPADYAKLEAEELEEHIKSIGLYRNKSKYIVKACQMLLDDYKGQVPSERKELMKLSGVGRKTANVVASSVFGEDAIAVDTHVFRVSNRIGLADSDNVRGTEEDLMEVIPKKLWTPAHHWLIFHGRNICKARNPQCSKCPVKEYCNYYEDLKEDKS
ncbi:endonuclease III [Orenia marismortui]|uniref:Endonuclease III n=1 Tax=Orenia marismortui TaxID=46469 RepID=A0A4R8H2M1_9FIRM|nr:endonuclease III [Orenia marismortui]TDX52754.1 DNA-(apurinic or apyrimidinic site) lyase /endonuclease III [Orenia marismortui]